MIDFNDFKKIEMKIGTIEKVEEIPNSDKLIKLKVNLGGEIKQAIAGIKKHYKPQELEGKQFVFVTNLQPAKLMGELSEVMVLATVDAGKVVLIKPEKEIKNGSQLE